MDDAPSMTPYERHIMMCIGEYCDPTGQAEILYRQLPRLLGDLGKYNNPCRTKRGRSPCLGVCVGGPLLVVYPDGIWYHHVTAEVLQRIVQEHLRENKPVREYIFHSLGPRYATEFQREFTGLTEPTLPPDEQTQEENTTQAAVQTEPAQPLIPAPDLSNAPILGMYELTAMTPAQYDQVNKDLVNLGHKLPKGLRFHAAGAKGNGYLIVDVWETEAQLRAFSDLLDPILRANSVTPVTPVSYPIYNDVYIWTHND